MRGPDRAQLLVSAHLDWCLGSTATWLHAVSLKPHGACLLLRACPTLCTSVHSTCYWALPCQMQCPALGRGVNANSHAPAFVELSSWGQMNGEGRPEDGSS